MNVGLFDSLVSTVASVAKTVTAAATNVVKSASSTISSITPSVSTVQSAAKSVAAAAVSVAQSSAAKASTATVTASPATQAKISSAINNVVTAATNVVNAAAKVSSSASSSASSVATQVAKIASTGSSSSTGASAKVIKIVGSSVATAASKVVAATKTPSVTEQIKLITSATLDIGKATTAVIKSGVTTTSATTTKPGQIMMIKAPETSVLDIGSTLAIIGSATPEKLKTYINYPAAIGEDFRTWQATQSNSALTENMLVAEASKLLLDSNALYRAVSKTDPQTGAAITPSTSDYVELALFPLFFTGIGGEEAAAKGSAKVLGATGLKLGEIEVELAAKVGGKTAKTLLEIPKLIAAEDGLKAATEAGTKIAADELKLLDPAIKNLLTRGPTAWEKVQVELYKRLSTRTVLPDTKVVIEVAKEYPLKAAGLIRQNAEKFVKLPDVDKAAILKAIDLGKVDRKIVEDALAAQGVILTKQIGAAGTKKLEGMPGLKETLLAIAGYAGTGTFVIWAAAEAPEALSYPFTDLLKAKKYKEALQSINNRMKIYGTLDPIVNWFHTTVPFLSEGAYQKYLAGKLAMQDQKTLLEKATGVKLPDVVEPPAEVEILLPEEIAVPKTGRITVSGQPQDAFVELDGVFQTFDTGASNNKAPMTISKVEVGPHNVAIHKTGFKSGEYTANVTEDGITKVNYVLEMQEIVPDKILVFISSSPTGAKIYTDGVYAFTTTPHVVELKAGAHLVELELDGYSRDIFQINVDPTGNNIFERTLKYIEVPVLPEGLPEITAAERERIAAELAKEKPAEKPPTTQTGWEYSITSSPPGASIYVNGNNTFKKTPGTIILEGNADYTIMVDLFGYKPALATVHTDPF